MKIVGVREPLPRSYSCTTAPPEWIAIMQADLPQD